MSASHTLTVPYSLNCNYNHVTSGYDGYYVTNVMRFWVGDGDPYGHTIDGHLLHQLRFQLHMRLGHRSALILAVLVGALAVAAVAAIAGVGGSAPAYHSPRPDVYFNSPARQPEAAAPGVQPSALANFAIFRRPTDVPQVSVAICAPMSRRPRRS